MKKIGLVGGLSWVSTMDYYRLINEGVNARRGGLNFAELIIYSLNFGDLQAKTWDQAFELLLNACRNLVKSGADGIALCANTAHMYIGELKASLDLPFIDIIDETSKAIHQKGHGTVALLGTKFTMEMDFYKGKLRASGLNVMVPEKQEARDFIQRTLKEELGRGIIDPRTKKEYISIIHQLERNGAESVILGCTEIPLLIKQQDIQLPVFDTTTIHVNAILDFITA